MTRNADLFDAIAKAIEEHPERYDQSSWGYELAIRTRGKECGTACCIAGWAGILSGGRPDPDGCGASWLDADGNPRPIDGWAKGLLGLTGNEAPTLFDEFWKPPDGETVPDALRRIGRGGDI